MKGKILIVEDQFIEANNLQEMLELAGYEVCGIARTVANALSIVEQTVPDLVLLDIFLKGPLTGIDLAQILRQKNIPFVYLSANSNRETLEAAKATRPYGFLVKPFRENDVLIMLEIAHYVHANSYEALMRHAEGEPEEAIIPAKAIPTPEVAQGNIIGASAKLRNVMKQLNTVAPAETSVLILGESGTGKEKIADSIHQQSARRNAPLIKINCAALPADLMDSLLFGHEKGAYTGATERRIGKFEQANGGTVFLDEIGEIGHHVQVKLLRVLQEKQIERVGSNEVVKVNVRIIAATNRNLEKEVAEGRFRMDLYYRLNVFPLHLPPLRERKEDIPLLVQHFISIHARRNGKQMTGIEEKAMKKLLQYEWPGNIRELEHCIERSVLLNTGKTIKEVMVPEEETKQAPRDKIKTIEENEREHIISVLKLCDGRIFGKGGAAELLGMNVSTLNFRIKKLGIDKTLLV